LDSSVPTAMLTIIIRVVPSDQKNGDGEKGILMNLKMLNI